MDMRKLISLSEGGCPNYSFLVPCTSCKLYIVCKILVKDKDKFYPNKLVIKELAKRKIRDLIG